MTMSTRTILNDASASTEARALFDDIREKRGTDYVNNFWRVLSHDPEHAKNLWERLQRVMAPGHLDPLVKELIYVAVSVSNSCSYCVHSHTAAAKKRGMTEEMHSELLAVIALANETNGLANALQVPVDASFDEAVG
jgi:AhpD family alkylhydroperoxidase